MNRNRRLLVMVGYGQHVSRQAEEERMTTTPGNADGHVQHDLGLYVLGALPQAERAAVEEHLRACATCRAECAELEQVPAFLGLLSLPEVDGLASTRPEPEVAAPARVPRSRPGAVGASAPAPGRPPGRPAGTASTAPPVRRGRLRGVLHRYRFVFYAAVVAMLVGIVTGAALRPGDPVALAGTEVDTLSGVRLSITAVGQDGGSHVTGDVSGLRPRVEYRLYAVAASGETFEVTRWVGGEGGHRFDGGVRMAADDLAFFTVVGPDGGVVVRVHVTRPSGG